MSSLKYPEKQVFEKLFNRNGYVLDFTDRTFAEFFRDYDINIDEKKYKKFGTSKMNRLRAFWELEPDTIVEKVLKGLLQHYLNITNQINEEDKTKAQCIIRRLSGKIKIDNKNLESNFLNQEFGDLDISLLNLEPNLEKVILQRLDEIKKSLTANSPLAVIFLCGSTLEGLLFNIAEKKQIEFNKAISAPKDKNQKPKQFSEWNLCNLIDVAHETGYLGLDIKKHSHSLRDFRNYIHPKQQAKNNFSPDMHTAKISWQVLQAVIANLTGKRNV
jgi:hypothetical protein